VSRRAGGIVSVVAETKSKSRYELELRVASAVLAILVGG